MSYISLKKQYEFTELGNGALRDKIEDMMKDCKKKVQKIQVYNESKKSTSKNAFLLKLLWIREFGIADNFINENSYDELEKLDRKDYLTFKDYIGKLVKYHICKKYYTIIIQVYFEYLCSLGGSTQW